MATDIGGRIQIDVRTGGEWKHVKIAGSRWVDEDLQQTKIRSAGGVRAMRVEEGAHFVVVATIIDHFDWLTFHQV